MGSDPYIKAAQRQDWETPHDLFDQLWREFDGFDLDPCGQREHHYSAWKICSQGGYFYDGSAATMDGLAHPWYGKVYMNPPYGPTVGHWVAKAAREVARGRAELVVALLKSTTDTRWWHDHVEGKAEYRFIRGRLKFGGAKGPAPFPSVIVVWRRQARMEGA